MIKRIKIIVLLILYILIGSIVLYIVLSSATKIADTKYKIYVITSNSMEPNINKGTVIITERVDKDKIENGNIITYNLNNEFITHRVIEKNEDEHTYITKGDNNIKEDALAVKYSQIQGKVIYKIPIIGKFILLTNNMKIFILILLLLIYRRIKKITAKEQNRRIGKLLNDEKE